MSETPVVTRFAPSPTGHLHIGGARTALFCWAFARRHGGRFVLRVEDTDRARSSEASTRGILEDLAWLGIHWDEGPAFDGEGGALGGDPRVVGPFSQSERIAIYTAELDRLLEKDLAYPAFDTPDELAHRRAEAEARKETFRYRRPADWDRDRALGRLREGESCVIRLRSPQEAIVVRDEVLGEVRFEAGELEDFVIRKADGFPTYHFAVVVDDALMGVTHVLRGQEHLMNTPKHVALQEALGFPTPHYAHLPLIFNPDGSKMGKRDKDKAVRREAQRHEGTEARRVGLELGVGEEEFERWVGDKTRQLPADVLRGLATALGVELPEIDVDDFRRSGYLAEVVCNYIALLGWNPGEKNADGTDLERFGMDYLASHFSIERIGKKPSKFDREKLRAFNADTIQKGLSAAEFAARWKLWLGRYDPSTLAALGDRFELAAGAVQARATTLADAIEPVRFALIDDDAVEFDEKAVEKVLRENGGEGLQVLQKATTALEAINPFTPEEIDSRIREWAEQTGIGMGKAAQPIRVAVTGSTTSPSLGETLALLGPESVLSRIRRCIEFTSR